MGGSTMKAAIAFAMMCASGLASSSPASAQSVMQQCGQQYQAAKAGGTLNGMTWNQFRTDCATRLKAQPASVTTGAPAAAPAVAPVSNPLKPAPATPEPATAAAAPVQAAPAAPTPASSTAASPGKTPSAGRTAFVARERQCGTEWKANKVSLKTQTPGLTWPKYLSQCNTRLKAAGQ